MAIRKHNAKGNQNGEFQINQEVFKKNPINRNKHNKFVGLTRMK